MSALIDAKGNGQDNSLVKKMIRAYNIQPPCNFWVGDIVYFSPETRTKVKDKDTILWDLYADDFIGEYSNKSEPFEVIGITKYTADVDKPWWFLCKCFDSVVWFCQDALLPNEAYIPNYKPRKVDRTLEAKNSMGEAEEITILIRNIDELNTLYNTLKPMGYIIHDIFFKLVKESNSPLNIFINLKTGDITQSDYMHSYDDWTKISTYDEVWEKELTIEDLSLIIKILTTKKIIIEPSYKPRNIKRIDEEVIIPNYMPTTPPELTPEEQREMFKMGDIVIVRPDAFDYFRDVDEGAMSNYFGRKVKIIEIKAAKEHYGWEDNDDSDLVKSNDLLITTVSADKSYPSRDEWYWHYKCLFNIKEIKPSYTPRKVDKTLESVKFDFSHIPSPILTPSQQSLQYKIGDTVIIRPDAFEYFYDANESMKGVLGKEGKIIEIEYAIEIYGDQAPKKGKDMTEDDMIITVETDSDPEDNHWYWFYRCLSNPEFVVPSYSPKKIDRTIESVDNLKYGGDYLDYRSSDAIPFGFENGKLLVGENGTFHARLWDKEIEEQFRNDYHINPEQYEKKFSRVCPPIIPIEKIEIFYGVSYLDYLNDLYQNELLKRARNLKFCGRLWTDHKVISFWNYPKDNEELKFVVNKLEDKLGIDIWNKEWAIEVKNNNSKIPEHDYEILPILMYEWSDNPSEAEWLEHMKSPLEKKKVFHKGFGSDSPKYHSNRSWQMASLTDESIAVNQ